MQNLTAPLHSKTYSYSPVVRVKRIGSTNTEFVCNCKTLQKQCTKQGYESFSIETEIKKIDFLDDLLDRKENAYIITDSDI